ncbi:porin [Vibrio aestuarianus]|uniref:porin n=1 Tax=Vibrio aestuarianus TaxID=28171 RepID=UPI00237C98C9|nr:porin [Vibrio aestuarianus]MDE1328708.1 porin [Vibrio aestuarianus]MDE1336004.1 porin [Vibrio aestuarianus]
MNKTLIALAVSAAAVATGVNAANVYSQDGTELNVGGRAEFRGDFNGTDSGEEIEGTMSNKSRFRLNVGGTTKINESLSGFGFYEAEQKVANSTDASDKTDNFEQRYMFAGLKGDFGAVSFGRQDTAAVQISQMSDVTTFTGTQKTFISAGNEQINNTILYTGEFVDGLNFKANYVAGEDKDTDSYGVSAIYTLPMGLGFGLGYSAGDNGEGQGSGNAIIAGVNYTLDSLYLAGTYTTGEIDDKTDSDFNGMEFAAKYGFGNGFTLMGAYQKSEIDENGQSKDKSDFFEITGDYAFNKNINAYVSYLFNNIDTDNLATEADFKGDEDTVRLGLMYAF